MDRKDFMKSLGGLCAGAGFLGCGCARTLAPDLEAQDETPLAERFDFAQNYVKRLYDILDRDLDPATRTRIVEAMGSACYEAWNNGKTAKPMPVDEFMAFLKKRSGENIVRREGNVITYAFAMKPGIAITRCGCPIAEKGPEGLSGTFCQCSVGYVRMMFSGYLGTPVRVELLEAIKRGGQTCRFKVTLA